MKFDLQVSCDCPPDFLPFIFDEYDNQSNEVLVEMLKNWFFRVKFKNGLFSFFALGRCFDNIRLISYEHSTREYDNLVLTNKCFEISPDKDELELTIRLK